MSNLSFVRHTGDGKSRSFTLAVAGENIGYFRTSDIHGYVDDVEVPITINPSSPHIVTFTVAPKLGADILIRRQMPVKKTYADFARGNNFGHRQVNNTFVQQLYLTQEILDGFFPKGFYIKSDIDMGGHRLCNVGYAKLPNDAVTKYITDGLSHRINMLEQSVTGNSRFLPWQYNAEGGEQQLEPPYNFTSARLFINGVRQRAGAMGSYYVDNKVIRLAEPLEEGDWVDVELGTEPLDSGSAEVVSLKVNNLHTSRSSLVYRAGLVVIDPLQLYSFNGKDYLPNRNKLPFTTSGSKPNSEFFTSADYVREKNTYAIPVTTSEQLTTPLDTSKSVIMDSKSWNVLDSNSSKQSPDKVKCPSGQWLVRSSGGVSSTLGYNKTPSKLKHRCGDFEYVKYSDGHAELLTDLSRFKPNTCKELATKVMYVDPSKENNEGDGLSWATAKQMINNCITENPDIIYVKAGVYPRFSRLQSFDLKKDLAIIAVGGIAHMGALSTGNWSRSGKVYKMTLWKGLTGATADVMDLQNLNKFGMPYDYIKVNSVQECADTIGSFFNDSSDNNSVYVNPVDGRDLTMNFNNETLRLFQTAPNCEVSWTGNHKLYIENIHFWGGGNDRNPHAMKLKPKGNFDYMGSVFYNKGCAFNGARAGQGNGLACWGISICISEKSQACYNNRDGFNYHYGAQKEQTGNLLAPHFVEIDCKAVANGRKSNLLNNQGSTAHENCVGLRINSVYHGHRQGGNIVDIDAAKVFHAGVNSSGSSIAGALLSANGWVVNDIKQDAEWWVDGATFKDNPEESTAQGDLATDGYWAKLHIRDINSSKPISDRSFTKLIDEDFS